MERVDVRLPGRSYPVLIGSGSRHRLAALVAEHSGVAVLADQALGDVGGEGRPVLRMPGGERAKTLAGLGTVLEFLEASGIRRDGALVVMGGGSLGDVGGLAASIWQRGIALYQVPTTLLAMVDSAIGGKTAINGVGAKNAIGSFWQPRGVIVDPDLLAPLPAAQYEAAFGEIAKYAVAQDEQLFQVLHARVDQLRAREPAALSEVIARCVRAKANVVAADERDEAGVREILNYGHTVAHGIEAASGFMASHGRAVAQGMRAAARIAASLGLCEAALVEAQDELLGLYRLPGPQPHVGTTEVLAALPGDKKSRGGEIRWVLPRALGRAETGHVVPAAVVEEAVRAILAR